MFRDGWRPRRKAVRDEDRLHRRAGDRRRTGGPARSHRRAPPRPRCRHPLAGAPQALPLGGGAGRHAGQPCQRHPGAGRQRGRAFRGHGARQRLGRRPARGAHVRGHGAEGGAGAGGVGRALEPGAPRRARGGDQRPEGRPHRARRGPRSAGAARLRRHQEMAYLLRLRRHRPRHALCHRRPGDRPGHPGARAHRGAGLDPRRRPLLRRDRARPDQRQPQRLRRQGDLHRHRRRRASSTA